MTESSPTNPPAPEPTNGEIKTLLVEHMRASNDSRERQAKDYARLDQKLQTVIDDQVRVRVELDRLKSDAEATARLAKNAESTATDLRGVVMREFGTITMEQKRRDELAAAELKKRDEAAALAQQKRDEKVAAHLKSQDVVLSNQNTELAKQTKTLGTLLTQIDTVLGIVKATPAVVAIIAAVLAGILWLSQHAH